MKKIISFIIVIIIASTLVGQNKENHYKPLSSFNNDTISFIFHNFHENGDYYKGKTLKELSKNIQIPIIRYSYFTKSETGEILGIYIYIYDELHVDNVSRQGWNVIKIYWKREKDSITDDKIDKMRRGNKYWNSEIYNLCKDFIISDIQLFVPESNKYYKKVNLKKSQKTNNGDAEFSPFIMEDFRY